MAQATKTTRPAEVRASPEQFIGLAGPVAAEQLHLREIPDDHTVIEAGSARGAPDCSAS
ncbi:MAG: hypothetical protein WDM92_00210 [Caulobacteraceae bacterium]